MARVVTLRLSAALVEAMRRQSEEAYPAECCGVLAGTPGQIKEVSKLVPMTNRRTDDPHRYLISPDDLRTAEAELRSTGLEVLGCYHSHPDHPAAPSAFDTEQAWPWYSYIIVRVDRGRAAEMTSWVLDEDRSAMRPESLDVLSEV
ncbi:MAG TPA: M67 family metallopeptidase [Gemmatimonadales bacterium]|nr:M67 family metallopeptidase [Gemmatimonadales bacterium]